MKALADGSVAIEIFSMTLGTINKIQRISQGNDFRIAAFKGRYYILSTFSPENSFTTVIRNHALRHNQEFFFVRPHRRGIPHTADREMFVIRRQDRINRSGKDRRQ